MEITTPASFPWLELIDRPAFCVKDSAVVAVNSAAENRMLTIGMNVREIVTEHLDVYENFENGSLYLKITAGGLPCHASITRTKECDIFLIHQTDDDNLQALALAAQQLRIPLSNVMLVTDKLFAELDNADIQQQAKQINHNLFQLLRIVSNMSDADSYKNSRSFGMETIDFAALIAEIMEKAQSISQDVGISLSYAAPNGPILGMANAEKIERAVYNLLSNALKFSPAGSTIEAKLIKSGNRASFIISNQNLAPVDDNSFWSRYRREPSIEDNRFGLGLGMTLISSIASAHGGTVLVDHPTPLETRVTMTVAIVKNDLGTVSSPVFRIGDYAGGRDKGLLELSEILPSDSYKKIN